MSKDDWSTGTTLITPHIEIGSGTEPHPHQYAHVNVDTFRECMPFLIPPFTDRGPTPVNSENIYCIYGVVGRMVTNLTPVGAYLNIDEPPISRTLMGYLEESVLKEKLPIIHQNLNARR